MSEPSRDALRRIPAVDRVLEWPALGPWIELYGTSVVTVQVRTVLGEVRAALEQGRTDAAPSVEGLSRRIVDRLEATPGRGLRRVINATGVVLHTNLGRAPLPEPVLERIASSSQAGCNLEFDLATGRRGERNSRVAQLIRTLTGAEDAIVVNNNAAALFLVLQTLAADQEVVLSRGEMVEIGGSFRIPEILAAAGTRLVEVGTTNQTRIEDYRRGSSEVTALLLKVHPSNYRVRGFTDAVSTGDLVALGRSIGVPVLVDEGAGLLRPRPEAAFRDQESVREALESGSDLVCFSGDKVLGGPQAGLIVGSADLVSRCRSHPLYRVLRPGRLIYAGLEDTLRRELVGEPSVVDRLWPDPVTHRERVERMVSELPGAEVAPVEGYVGGGAAPDAPVSAPGISLPFEKGWLESLRRGDPPVVAYVRDDRLWVDLRTVDPGDDEVLMTTLRRLRPSEEAGVGTE